MLRVKIIVIYPTCYYCVIGTGSLFSG